LKAEGRSALQPLFSIGHRKSVSHRSIADRKIRQRNIESLRHLRQKRAGTVPILAKLLKISTDLGAKIYNMVLPGRPDGHAQNFRWRCRNNIAAERRCNLGSFTHALASLVQGQRQFQRCTSRVDFTERGNAQDRCQRDWMIVQPQRDERSIGSIKIETIVRAMVAALRQKLGSPM
jgi:hypothetical protein